MSVTAGGKCKLLVTMVVASLISASPFALADGKAIYLKACAICHASLPPKLSDKATWRPRLEAGIDVLVQSVVKGKGKMPPIGNGKLSDTEIRAAVEYMIEQVK